MKLKKLEINGFKSFHEKETIQFPLGISAVVGPNGCGKSNLIDALRWVMGEQSVKQLRGKAMEDVIFSGANGKPPLNMAEVSLILINDNGSAPEEFRDYAEIMCTRRLYRSGESAYFLNKRPCRLKDIHNLFLGSGLGSKSYAMIQQGNIGAIIDAGPDERRFFIEEAAGVTRFKRRKDEALQKIESTHQNLLRLTDITTEIKRQMTSLKRQARKAELYQKYQKQIRQLDILISIHKQDDYKHQIDETAMLLKNLQDTDVAHTTRLKQIDAAVEEIKLKRWQKDQTIAELKSRRFETQRRLDRTENDLSHYRQDMERMAEEIAKLTSSHGELEGKDLDMTTEIDIVEKQITTLHNEEKQIRLKLDQEKVATAEIQETVSVLNQELEADKSELMDLVTQEARYKNIYQNVTSNKQNLKRRLKRLDEEALQSQQQVNECQRILKEAQAQFDAFEYKINNITDYVKVLQIQLEEKKQALAKQVKQVQTLELDRNKTRSQHSTLKKMADNFEGFKDGVKAIMRKRSSEEGAEDAELKKLRTEGLISIMADTIEPKPSFEIPVEAVLGEILQHIIVKDQKTGVGFIHYLQSHHAGRSGFIPVSGIKPLKSGDQKKPDPSRLLLNHVSVKPGFEAIAQALLGHVVLAEDIDEAEKIFSSNGTLQTVVTKRGDVVSHQGILVGGSKEKLSGILEKRQELKQLEHELADFDKASSAARLVQQKMESDLRESESLLQHQIEKKNGLLHDRTEAEKDVYKASEDLKHAKRRYDIICLEQEQLLGEENDLDEELSKYESAATEISVAVKAAQDKVTANSERISVFSLDMDRFNQTIVDLKLELTALSARIENNNNTLSRLKTFREDGILRLQAISRDLHQKKQQQVTSNQKLEELSVILSTLYDELKHLEQELESHEVNYQAIEAELKNNDSRVSEIQTQKEALSQKIRVLEIEQSERHIQRSNISNRLTEQYRCDIEDLRIEVDLLLENQQTPLAEMEEALYTLRTKISRIIDVNLSAIKEYNQLQNRFVFLNEQRDDLISALDDLQTVIKKINRITQERFMKTLDEVNQKLKEVFPRLFEGGSAQLVLAEPDKPLESGLAFMIYPPGKKITRMSLLSGGEKALSAIAFIFSIFLIKPASFCLMDEIDAPLDDVNIYRFNNLLQIIGEKSQIIMITHNKKTMEFADKLFGITMVNKGISKVVSVNLNQPDSTAATTSEQVISV